MFLRVVSITSSLSVCDPEQDGGVPTLTLFLDHRGPHLEGGGLFLTWACQLLAVFSAGRSGVVGD